MAKEKKPQPVWTLTDARRRFYQLFDAALLVPQIVTRRGVPSYIFRPATPAEAEEAGCEQTVIVEAIHQEATRA